jgi:hypothetical protein
VPVWLSSASSGHTHVNHKNPHGCYPAVLSIEAVILEARQRDMAFGSSELVPGQGNTLPPPNFINPTTRVPIVLGLTISTCLLALALTGGRLYARAHMKRMLEIDDWMMLFAVFLAVVLTILGATSCLYGLGYHLWDTRPEWEEPYYKVRMSNWWHFLTLEAI